MNSTFKRNRDESEYRDSLPNYGGGLKCVECGHPEMAHRTLPGENGACGDYKCLCRKYISPIRTSCDICSSADDVRVLRNGGKICGLCRAKLEEVNHE